MNAKLSLLAASASLLVLAGVAAGGVVLFRSRQPAPPSPHGSHRAPAKTSRRKEPHVMVIMDENQGYFATQSGCPASPSYFCLLASRYASVVPWYGATHPSLPNYLAITSGSTQGCSSDGCIGPYRADNLGYQLSRAGIPWVAYMESMPSPCYRGPGYGEYAEKHDPFVFYQDLLRGNLCPSHVLPYPGSRLMLARLDSSSPPDFVWITPNLIDDMHNGTVAQGSSWLRGALAPVLRSGWFRDYPSTVIVTEDENDQEPQGRCCNDASGGQILELVISRRSRGRGTVRITGDQYGTLRSVEEAYHLPLLEAARDPVNGELSRLFG